MNLPLVFRPVAQAEFDEAATWYESQKPGLGDDFVAAVQPRPRLVHERRHGVRRPQINAE